MDKETLSNYGWIVICVLVLAVMLALATPFGKFISGAIENTTTALFQTSKAGLGSAGIDAGELVFGKQDGGAENPDTPDVSASKITLLQSVDATNSSDILWKKTTITEAELKDGEKIKVEFYEIDANTKQPVSSPYTTMIGNAFNKELTADQLPATFDNPNGKNGQVFNINMAIAMKISVIDADGNAVDFDMDNMSYFTKTPKAAIMNIRYVMGSTDAHLTESASTTPSSKNLIPVGGIYTQVNGTKLIGDGVSVEFPETVAMWDNYEYGDYKYTYNKDGGYGTEWSVAVKDTTKTSYGEILSEIAGKPVTNMYNTFKDCTSLTTAPAIPSSVTNMVATFKKCSNLTKAPEIPGSVESMNQTFEDCTSLKTYVGSTDPDGDFSNYKIPSSVTNIGFTFYGCISLTTAPTIPSSVTSMDSTFENCKSLTGTIEINANLGEYDCLSCFAGTIKSITLVGTSTKLTELAASATNSNVTVVNQ